MSTRRTFIAGLGATAAWPLAARAQQAAIPVIGWLSGGSAQGFAEEVAELKRALATSGYVEGRDVAVEYRWAEGHYDRSAALAADLINRKVAVIVATAGAVTAAKSSTTAIPVVFVVGVDPVATGLVATLARPGGNLTGITILTREVAPKKLELLHELLPRASTIAALINPTGPSAAAQASDLQQAAQAFGLELHVLHASADREIESAFEAAVRMQAGGLVIGADSFFFDRSGQLATLAQRYAVPAIFQFRDFAAAGGLMSYGASGPAPYDVVGAYVARILNGEKPANLPVQQTTKVELIINLKTAKALGLTVPITLLGRADEVIE